MNTGMNTGSMPHALPTSRMAHKDAQERRGVARVQVAYRLYKISLASGKDCIQFFALDGEEKKVMQGQGAPRPPRSLRCLPLPRQFSTLRVWPAAMRSGECDRSASSAASTRKRQLTVHMRYFAQHGMCPGLAVAVACDARCGVG